MKIYVFGNGNLGFEEFLSHYVVPLQPLHMEATDILLCDFRGVDTLMMEYLKTISVYVTVFHIGERPRYLPDKFRTKVGEWKLVGGFKTDRERDGAAIEACTHFLAFDFNSDENRRSGTQHNIERCLALGKERLGVL